MTNAQQRDDSPTRHGMGKVILMYRNECWTVLLQMKSWLEQTKTCFFKRMPRIQWTDHKRNEEFLSKFVTRSSLVIVRHRSSCQNYQSNILNVPNIDFIILCDQKNEKHFWQTPKYYDIWKIFFIELTRNVSTRRDACSRIDTILIVRLAYFDTRPNLWSTNEDWTRYSLLMIKKIISLTIAHRWDVTVIYES